MGEVDHLVEVVVKGHTGYEKYTLKFDNRDVAEAEYNRLHALRFAVSITDVVLEDRLFGLTEWSQPANTSIIHCTVKSNEIDSVRLIMRGTPERVKQTERLGSDDE